MQSPLLHRETGDLPPRLLARHYTTTLLPTFAPFPNHRFNGDASPDPILDDRPHAIKAHGAGVSSLALDKFDGRILLSGGADGAIKVWDLEGCGDPSRVHTFRATGTITRRVGEEKGGGHSHGVTHLGFYPFDSGAFLSSAYDKTLKLWSTRQCTLSASFDLNATIYSHSMSPVADHLVVACATQNPHVKLVDLKSGSAVQALVAHGGPVLSTAWSPRQEHVLVSGHADGKIRVWDIRRAGGVIGLLDQEDSLGVVHRYKHTVAAGGNPSARPLFRASAQAHDDAVNGLHWTADGKHIVSAGMDGKIRVWDAATGANTLTSFGALVQNKHARTTSIITTPPCLSANKDILFWANDQEILAFDISNGKLVTKLRSAGVANPLGPRSTEIGRNRISSIVWRSSGGGAASVGPIMGGNNDAGSLYSSHLDGQIRCWKPQLPGPEDVDDEEKREDGGDDSKKRKRKAVDDAYKSLMGKQITFT